MWPCCVWPFWPCMATTWALEQQWSMQLACTRPASMVCVCRQASLCDACVDRWASQCLAARGTCCDCPCLVMMCMLVTDRCPIRGQP